MTPRALAHLATLAVVAALVTACTADDGGSPPTAAPGDTRVTADPGPAATGPDAPRDRSRSGGDGTVMLAGTGAFAQPLPTLTAEERRAFSVGNNFFNDNWVTAPASTEGRDGLGPLLNAQSCSSCHEFDGRGEPPSSDDDPVRGLLLRLSVPGAQGATTPDPNYGGQLQDRAINGVEPEGRIVITNQEISGTFSDGTAYTLLKPSYEIADLAYGPLAPDVQISPRIAPPVFGVGLLEAVPESTVLAAADPDDADGDGISGRANRVPDKTGATVLGRFGWKANVATVEEQNAGAFHGDIGVTTSLHPDQECTDAQAACLAAPTGGSPEVDDQKLARVTFYTRTLAVPARRAVAEPDTDAGEALFTAVGCASCHLTELRTGSSAPVAQLADQVIHPYTDLLLHDMGPDLADGRPDFEASRSEWRTAPLWGIGLVDEINGHTRFLHDGRARSLEEAILWHGGEGEGARRAYTELPAVDRARLLTFLESL